MSLTIAPSTPAPTAMHLPAAPISLSLMESGLPAPPSGRHVSPLVMADHLLTLAEHAHRAGFQTTASKLLKLVFTVMDQRGAPN